MDDINCIREIQSDVVDNDAIRVLTILQVLMSDYQDNTPIVFKATQRDALIAKMIEICERW